MPRADWLGAALYQVLQSHRREAQCGGIPRVAVASAIFFQLGHQDVVDLDLDDDEVASSVR
jgi:hypothetical protein